jgi:phosphate transport system permease protein
MLTAKASRSFKEGAIGALLFACAAASTLITLGVVLVLVRETVVFFSEVSIIDFLTDTRWEPMFQEQHFGVLPLLVGSVMVAVGAGVLALPIGLMTAIFLSEYASPRLRRALKPLLEILAGIPTVVYGYFALTFVTPLIRIVVPETEIFNAAAASIVVGIMIIPTVSSLSEDALRAVPDSLREGAYGLGATKLEVSTQVVVPAALSGVIAEGLATVEKVEVRFYRSGPEGG